MFGVFWCEVVCNGGGVLWIVLLERPKGFGISDDGILKWTLGVAKFLLRLGCMICLSFVHVFGFWLRWLVLLRFWWREGYILYIGSYCGSLRGAWRTTDSKGSDTNACLSSNKYGFSWNEIFVDDWGDLSDWMCCWRFLGCRSRWGLLCGLLIGNFEKIFKFYLRKNFSLCWL